jgi:acyl-CoA synthetase (AMP-forming)/AMP-acid ligase II
VAAVVELRAGAGASLEQIQEHCRTKIAGFKVPRELHVVDSVVRSPSGKPDYPWAKQVVEARAAESGGDGKKHANTSV